MSAVLYTDRVRPFPKWPMTCVVENRPAHTSEKAAREWLTKIAMGDLIYRVWLCAACLHWHHPGSSSGKAIRKLQFLERKGELER